MQKNAVAVAMVTPGKGLIKVGREGAIAITRKGRDEGL